jgi:hypothetical protein
MTLTATKSFLYNTRRLLAGDDFEVTKPIHGKLLVAAKKAREKREVGKLSAPPLIVTDKAAKASRKHKVDPTDPVEVPDDAIVAARAEYQEKVGKRPFMGWDAETVRAKMAEAEASEPVADPEPVVEAAVEETDEDAAS